MQKHSLLKCIKRGLWHSTHIGLHGNGPVYGDIVTHNGYDVNGNIFIQEFLICPCGCGINRAFAKKEFIEIQPPMTVDISEFQHQTQTV